MYDGSRPSTPSKADHSTVTLPTTTPQLAQEEQMSGPSSFDGDDSYHNGTSSSKERFEQHNSSPGAQLNASKSKRKPSGTGSRTLVSLVVLALVFWLVLGLSDTNKQRFKNRFKPILPASVSTFIAGADPTTPHPIVPLLTTADQKWNSMLASQSKSFDKAVRTYRNKYGRKPPPGFDKWYAFATQGRNHTLVDEYDSLMEDLEPFRGLTPAELRRRTAELAQLPGISIVSIRNGVAQVHSKAGKWAPALAFQQMIGAFVRNLPDMDIAINEKPEGRVLPRKERRILLEDYGLEGDEIAPNMSDPMYHPTLNNFKAEWLKESERDGSTWESFRRACPPDSAARRLIESVRSAETGSTAGLLVQGRTSSRSGTPTTRRRMTGNAIPPTRELTFNPDLDAGYNICNRPSLHSLHSAFFSDQRSIEYLYPVFSPSKPQGYADILIPPNQYWSPPSEFTYEWELKKGRTKEPTDLEWSDKKATMFWRGKVTRGADTPPGHASTFQKQRLVKMANDGNLEAHKILVTLNTTTGEVHSAPARILAVNKVLMDVAMACDPSLGECAYLRSLGYRVEPPGPLSDAWNYKIVLDVDEIGFSPRFLALQESKSAVVKSSIQREFWRNWAVPWKHFVPVSSSYSELYNIYTFFEGIPPAFHANKTTLTQPFKLDDLVKKNTGAPYYGDSALKDIAMAGREWKQQHVRRADMECYVYRLMIEWANLVAPPVDEAE